MNYIDITSTKIIRASHTHYNELLFHILDKLEEHILPIDEFYCDWIAENLETLLIGTPKQLFDLNSVHPFNSFFQYKKIIEGVFDYSRWFSVKKVNMYCAYNLAQNLNINTCCYCNRLYTKTVTQDKNKITRPQFDHWFPKEQYPLLALSFYNLIPSCAVCNTSLKNTATMSLTDYMHPYVDTKENYLFSFVMKTHNSYDFKVKDGGNPRVKNTMDLFKVQEIYETHMDEIDDLVSIKRKYSESYLHNLRTILKVNISDDELYRLAFSTYKNEPDFEKRPLSRMKRDLLEELRIIPVQDRT